MATIGTVADVDAISAKKPNLSINAGIDNVITFENEKDKTKQGCDTENLIQKRYESQDKRGFDLHEGKSPIVFV